VTRDGNFELEFRSGKVYLRRELRLSDFLCGAVLSQEAIPPEFKKIATFKPSGTRSKISIKHQIPRIGRGLRNI
jgi:hypothetical protein